ncbi:energy transducer TonB [Sphingomonas sp. HHU CXW]|uniref:Energy transducer TonB n=1 Tax=Sphingomonas hominis TaxID=2741495 RepID=A0ABX2JFU3_9SPHN|nr:energy transducer TonB [Sphingomonas hominis]NTS65301.1 energy transducer TonB [Sphingomonas hominis]
MAYSDQAPGSRRIATIAGVAVIHGLLGFAFVTGMASSFVTEVSRTLTTSNVPVETPPPPDTPPPPEQTATAPASASSVTTVIPRVPTPAASSTVFVDLLPASPSPLPPAPIDVAPPSPPVTVSKASAVRAIGNRNTWITTDDYPAAALRAEDEGSVAISVQIGSDGRVTGCTVTASSGSSTLDSAACRLYQRRARFEPARDDAGAAIATSYTDRVRWQLPR